MLSGPFLTDDEFITVYKEWDEFFVRSRFSEEEDLVIHTFRYANEKAWLIPRDSSIEKCQEGKLLHLSYDDYPANPPLGKFGTLSGNHGSFYASLLEIPGHGLTVRDLGGIVKEKNGRKYIILHIQDKDHIIIHPEGRSHTLNPGFVRHNPRNRLFFKNRKLAFQSSVMRQLYPLNRITDCRLLADGVKNVPEKEEIRCRFVDFIFVHDVLNTYYVVQSVKKSPGIKPFPEWSAQYSMVYAHTPELQKKYATYMKFPALATFYNKFRFESRGAAVNYRKTVFHVALSEIKSGELMFMWSDLIARQERQLFYVPKLKPVTVREESLQKDITIDLSGGYPLPRDLNVSYFIQKEDAVSAEDLPDRFIRLSGPDDYHYGIALGYSLFMGSTARENTSPERDTVYFLYRTHKMYPQAYVLKNTKPGRTIETVAYRQYFNPRLEPDATSFYCHHQGDSLIVYMDFHKILKEKTIALPEAATGKKITILEKTPFLILHTPDTVPAAGIRLSNNTEHGYLVLKLD